MLESITYTGPAYPVDEGELNPNEEPTHISGSFDVIDIVSDERGSTIFVNDEHENEYAIDGNDFDSANSLDEDSAFGDEEE